MNRQIFEYHPIIGYKFISDLRLRIPHEAGGYLLRTNSQGFRSEFNYEIDKSLKTRISVFGDSFTAGDGVSNKFRYTDVLQNALPDTEIYNFGLPGSGTDQQYLLFKEYGSLYKPDLVVIAILVENIRRVNAQYRYFYNEENEKLVYQKPYYELSQNTLYLKNTPVSSKHVRLEEMNPEEQSKIDTGGRFETARNILNTLGLKEVTQRLTNYQPLPEYNSQDSSSWLLLKNIIKQWVREIECKVLIVPIPLYQYIEETSSATAYQQRFKELAEELNVPVADPLPYFLKYPLETRRTFRFKNDVHPTPTGHQALTDFLLPIIKSIVQ